MFNGVRYIRKYQLCRFDVIQRHTATDLMDVSHTLTLIHQHPCSILVNSHLQLTCYHRVTTLFSGSFFNDFIHPFFFKPQLYQDTTTPGCEYAITSPIAHQVGKSSNQIFGGRPRLAQNYSVCNNHETSFQNDTKRHLTKNN